jgi:hypothetical protein
LNASPFQGQEIAGGSDRDDWSGAVEVRLDGSGSKLVQSEITDSK